jgi:hypothetical protein
VTQLGVTQLGVTQVGVTQISYCLSSDAELCSGARMVRAMRPSGQLTFSSAQPSISVSCFFPWRGCSVVARQGGTRC